MSMELTNERPSTGIEYDFTLSNTEAKMLREYGLKEIQQDEEALINYAVNRILLDMTKNLTTNVENLKKLVENKQKVKKNLKKA